MTSKWHANDLKNIKPYKEFEDFRLQISKLFVVKTFLGSCKWFFAAALIPILFIRIFLSSTTGFGNLNNLKGGLLVVTTIYNY